MKDGIAILLTICAANAAYAQKIDSRELFKPLDIQTKRPEGGAPARAPDQAPPQAAPVTPPLSKTATTGIPPGAYCEAGFDAFSGFLARPQTGSPSPPSVALIYDNCLVGDVIVIPGGFAVYSAQVCDLSRPMTAVPNTGATFAPASVICTLGARKPVRSNR
jgi:hypothetical protein